MPLKAAVETLEGLDEGIAQLYMEKDGVFVLDVEPVAGIELSNTTGLLSTVSTLRTEVKAATAAAKKFDGLDADEARTAIQTLADLGDLSELQDLDGKVEARLAQHRQKFDSDLARIQTESATAIEERDTQLSTLRDQMGKSAFEAQILSAVSDTNGIAATLGPALRERAKVEVGQDGVATISVTGDDGEPRMSSGLNAHVPMTLTELANELKGIDDFKGAFRAEAKTGGGSSGGGGNVSGKMIISRADAADGAKFTAFKKNAIDAGREWAIAQE